MIEDKDKVCSLKKELYGLKKEPRTLYERLDNYLEKVEFVKGMKYGNLCF